ncbi:G/U mismatch-specific uracil-DNA glycosylase [Acidovorax sp. 69]|uniref:DNA-deoxyinosine glycosylase n=1 Tax=Acidovorax sp. 69 TaxID=2035202 RepID=UPI000C246EC2|nr:DNA-deoxyinosine glycosylase [Acidovorax sp. 69]PJI96631.1 G/U mismatch-specific uracil-DNA glycosylase [Acidovorax sp. 69]
MPEANTPAGTLPAPETGASGRPVRWYGLPPVASAQTVVLILGSFPGAASLRARQYYAHPQNQFWKILQALWPQHPLPCAGSDGYLARCEWLLARGLGLWDVYESCEREGSLDTSIRNARLNDFARLHGHCPRLAAVAHNGGESFKHAGVVLGNLNLPLQPSLLTHDASGTGRGAFHSEPIEAVRLPSTSPANASWSFDRKLVDWAALMSAHHLL